MRERKRYIQQIGPTTINQRRHAGIQDLVYEYQNQEVTEPSDKIYSLLGIGTDLFDTSFRVSYEDTKATVYIKFAKFILTRNEPRDLSLIIAVSMLSACSMDEAGRVTNLTYETR
jgi:hypothetical protein